MQSTVSFPSTALVVDDEPVVLKLVSFILEARGITVTTATSGPEALELLEKTAFACLMIDKNLGTTDGITILRAAKKLQPYCASLVMTAYSSTASAIEALRLGAADYIEKPFADLDLVGARVEAAIKTSRVAYERDHFHKELKTYEAQLASVKSTIETQQTEIELFEKVLDLRVTQATADMRAQLAKLQESVTQGNDYGYVLQVNLESILDSVREAQYSNDPALAGARSVIARIAHRLESHLGLVAVRSDAPKKP
jgi:DNA-binding response OmpR family regulator